MLRLTKELLTNSLLSALRRQKDRKLPIRPQYKLKPPRRKRLKIPPLRLSNTFKTMKRRKPKRLKQR